LSSSVAMRRVRQRTFSDRRCRERLATSFHHSPTSASLKSALRYRAPGPIPGLVLKGIAIHPCWSTIALDCPYEILVDIDITLHFYQHQL
jgi:hypothetical protein